MAEEKKNIKYAGQLVDVARKTTRFVVDDMIRAMDDNDGDPFLGVFSRNSIYRWTIIDFREEENVEGRKMLKAETYLANIPLPDLTVIEEHTNIAEQRLFDVMNGSGFQAVEAKLDHQTGLIKKIGNILMKAFKMDGQKKEGAPAPLTDDEMRLIQTQFWMGATSGQSPYSILMGEDKAKAVDLLKQQREFLEKNAAKYEKNRKMVEIIDFALKAYQAGRLNANGASTEQAPVVSEDDPKMDVYTSSMKYLSANMSDKEGRRRWYQVSVTCYPKRNYQYAVTITNHFAHVKTTASGLTQMDPQGAVWGKPKVFNLTEAEWLHIVREMKDNRDNARLCFYSNARKEDVKRRFANRTQN